MMASCAWSIFLIGVFWLYYLTNFKDLPIAKQTSLFTSIFSFFFLPEKSEGTNDKSQMAFNCKDMLRIPDRYLVFDSSMCVKEIEVSYPARLA